MKISQKGFRVTELTQFLISKISNSHRFVENIDGVMILVLNTFSDHAYICTKCHENISWALQSYGGTGFPICKTGRIL